MSWTTLRATRWKPPGAASSTPARALTYVFALEQAEQMFKAAESVGQATRPLLAYYGLNQAGRAIAAAAVSVHGDDWRLSGHGITARNLDGPLPQVAIRSEAAGNTGSFVRLAKILDSPLWTGPVPLRQFWDAIPGNRDNSLVDDDSRRTPLYVDHTGLYGEPHPLATVPVCYFPPWVISAEDGREALDSYLAAFPTAQGYHSYVRAGRGSDFSPAFSRHDDGWGELQMNWMVAPDESDRSSAERQDFIASITRAYGSSRYFFPAIGGTGRDIHPLMAWWAVLHSLSMLARYQPAEWSGHIDVDASRHAVALELVLSESLTVLPIVIAETIEQASRTP
jgi:hypothetical protein